MLEDTLSDPITKEVMKADSVVGVDGEPQRLRMGGSRLMGRAVGCRRAPFGDGWRATGARPRCRHQRDPGRERNGFVELPKPRGLRPGMRVPLRAQMPMWSPIRSPP